MYLTKRFFNVFIGNMFKNSEVHLHSRHQKETKQNSYIWRNILDHCLCLLVWEKAHKRRLGKLERFQYHKSSLCSYYDTGIGLCVNNKRDIKYIIILGTLLENWKMSWYFFNIILIIAIPAFHIFFIGTLCCKVTLDSTWIFKVNRKIFICWLHGELAQIM